MSPQHLLWGFLTGALTGCILQNWNLAYWNFCSCSVQTMSQVQWLESNSLYLCFLSYPAQFSDTLCQIQRTPLCIHLPIPHSHTDKYFRKQTELITSWHPSLLLLTWILFHDLIRALVLGSSPHHSLSGAFSSICQACIQSSQCSCWAVFYPMTLCHVSHLPSW